MGWPNKGEFPHRAIALNLPTCVFFGYYPALACNARKPHKLIFSGVGCWTINDLPDGFLCLTGEKLLFDLGWIGIEKRVRHEDTH